MTQDTKASSAADAEYTEAWGDDAMAPAKLTKQAQEAQDASQREQDEFDAAFSQQEDGAK